MKKDRLRIIALIGSFCIVASIFSVETSSQSRRNLSKADIDRMMTELTNWGRWGKDDQLGAANLITPAKRKEALKQVKDGVSVSLAHNTNTEKADDNGEPFEHTMAFTGESGEGMWSADKIGVFFHGYQHTHLDALCHMFYQGKMFNGFSQTEVTRRGAGKLAITMLKQGIMTRGILMDIPRLKGVPYLEPDVVIYPEDLEAWEKKAGLKLQPGDAVFIRTGRWARRAAKGPWNISMQSAGLHASCARWLKQRDVALLGSDAASDVLPSRIEGVTHPVHQLVLIAMGMNIFDNCDLEAVSEAAAARNRWEFLLTAAPIAVSGGTGSPLNPIATF